MKTNKSVLFNLSSCVIAAMFVTSCNTANNGYDDYFGQMQPGGEMGQGGGMSNGSVNEDGDAPDFNNTISAWGGEKANDASADIVGTDADFYHEANSFKKTVKIDYNGNDATVESSSDDVIVNKSGAYVTIDMATNTVSGVEIIASGTSDNGALKIYGTKKFKLTLNGLNLTSQIGPAINNQCKKRMFVHLNSGTTNYITDSEKYSDDPYYLADTDEDRKGCLFSESNLIFSGTGTLVVAGKKKHGIATDGYFWMRPGVTIVINEAAKNGIHVKGDEDDKIGITIKGGLIYANIASTAGKAIKTDLDVTIDGGEFLLNTSGDATYDSDEKDTSSAAAIKTDGNININGGTLTLKSTGTGGKGLNSDGDINIAGGETTITTTGGKYYYSSSLTSSPKGAKADGNVNISGGKLNIAVTGVSDGSEGLENKSTMTISGGETYVYAYDDAINAATAINISGGKVFAYALNNDGIDSNGTLTISGGLVIASGTSSPECGIDVDSSNNFKINGGTVIAIGGGTLQSKPSSSSSQYSVEYGGLTLAKGKYISVLDSSNKPVLSFLMPKSLSGGSFFFSSSTLKSGSSYTISSGGTLTSPTDTWNGWYDGGTWSSGTTVKTFSISSKVTSLGTSTSGGQGGGMGW